MGGGFASSSLLLLFALLVIQYSCGIQARMIERVPWNNDAETEVHISQEASSDHIKIYSEHKNGASCEQKVPRNDLNYHPSSHMVDMDPSLNVFFTVKDLYVGNEIPIYFAIKDPSTSPHLLPREESDPIPFSSSQLEYVLSLFSFSKDSPQAKAMEHTLKLCEMEPKGGEIKFCVTSLESMLDSVRDVFGLETEFKLITTITHPSDNTTLLQNYTIVESPQELVAHKMVACHTMPYPYAVFYCHGNKNGENKVFKVPLLGDNGDKVEAVSVCHMNSSSWDDDHVAFRVLGTGPGCAPVCHFFPSDNLVWVPSSSLV